MGGILRRRELILPSGSLPEWDFEWDYTMGAPTDNGMRESVSGSNLEQEMTESGWKIHAGDTSSSIYLYPFPAGTTASTGEIVVEFTTDNKFANSNENLVVAIGDGTNKAAVRSSNKYLKLRDTSNVSSGTIMCGQALGTEVNTIHLILNGSTFDAYLNDLCLVRDYPSSRIPNANGIYVRFIPANTNGTLYLRSIKVRKNRIVTEQIPNHDVPEVGENILAYRGILHPYSTSKNGSVYVMSGQTTTSLTSYYYTYAHLTNIIEHVDGAEYAYKFPNKYYGLAFFDEKFRKGPHSSTSSTDLFGGISKIDYSAASGTLVTSQIPADTKYIMFTAAKTRYLGTTYYIKRTK